MLWLERPNEISFTVSNNGSTAINNIAISIHDLDAAAAWVIANTHGGRMLGTSEQFDAATIRLINIQALSPHTAATRAAFYNLSGLTVRRFMLDTFAGDETSRLFVKLAKVNGQWLIATSLSRRTGDEQQQTIENIPPRFPRDIEGKVDFN